MKYKVEGSKKMIRVCEVSTAVVTAVSADFSNTQKMLQYSKKGLVFLVLAMMYKIVRKKNYQRSRGVNCCFDSCISWFLKHTKKL